MAIQFRENQVFAVGPEVFVREAVDNCAWADLGDGVVVIDAQEDTAMCPLIGQAIAETVGKPLKWVVNTHWHSDHIACNPSWAALGATVIAHESCAPATTAHDGKPDITFKDRYTLKGAERNVDLEWLGGTHTPADTVVHFPWARVLHIADLFGWGLFPMQRLTQPTAGRMREIIERILTYDVDTLICGHGPLLTPDHLRRWLAYFNDMLEQAPRWQEQGLDKESLLKVAPPPADMEDWWRFFAWKHARNLEMVAGAQV
ncbi:MAG TPA: MBL fold metallo-hydrolase [Armatimonadota bacterium]|nr:MBL fold metallo-hydrolase [Armatimonadota bacterium]